VTGTGSSNSPPGAVSRPGDRPSHIRSPPALMSGAVRRTGEGLSHIRSPPGVRRKEVGGLAGPLSLVAGEFAGPNKNFG